MLKVITPRNELPAEQTETLCKGESDLQYEQTQIWEKVALQYQQEIQILEHQIYQNQMQQIYNQQHGVPKSIFDKLKQMKMGKSSKSCSVCFQEFQKGEMIIQLPCKHIFHKNCLKPWLKTNKHCPNCRFDVVEHYKTKDVKTFDLD